jgi:hypothetical protein
MPKKKKCGSVDEIRTELDRICKKFGGKFSTQNVVDESRAKSSALYRYFPWDDYEAAETHRRKIAADLIARVEYTIVRPHVNGKKVQYVVRQYASLKPDRLTHDGPGVSSSYQELTSILSSSAKRSQLIQQAFDELMLFKRKYSMLEELQPLMSEIVKLMERPMEVTNGKKDSKRAPAVTTFSRKVALSTRGKQRTA